VFKRLARILRVLEHRVSRETRGKRHSANAVSRETQNKRQAASGKRQAASGKRQATFHVEHHACSETMFWNTMFWNTMFWNTMFWNTEHRFRTGMVFQNTRHSA